MAGPQNNFNSTRQTVTIFAPDGTEHNTNRPNAIDMVRTAGYRWKREDLGKPRTEDEGPENPSAPTVTIYSKDGEPLETSRANAREMVNTLGYTWHPASSVVTEEQAAAAVIEAATAVAATEAAIEAEAAERAGPESLREEALRVAGEEDVAKYLEGFSLDALKAIAEERFGEKIHHRASSETAIAKLVELDDAAQTVN